MIRLHWFGLLHPEQDALVSYKIWLVRLSTYELYKGHTVLILNMGFRSVNLLGFFSHLKTIICINNVSNKCISNGIMVISRLGGGKRQKVE